MTQAQMILNYLRCGKSITHKECEKVFGATRLAARINELRKNYEIEDVFEKNKNGSYHKRYFLKRYSNKFKNRMKNL